MRLMKMCPRCMTMVLRWNNDIKPPLNLELVQLNHIIEALETKAQITSYKNLLVHITKVRRKTSWEQNLPSKMDMEKNMKVNISHHHVSPTPRSDLI